MNSKYTNVNDLKEYTEDNIKISTYTLNDVLVKEYTKDDYVYKIEKFKIGLYEPTEYTLLAYSTFDSKGRISSIGDNPAHYSKDGDLECYVYGKEDKKHRNGSPAYISHFNGVLSEEEYWLNGSKHNPNGSATVKYLGKGKTQRKYYIHDKEYTETDFKILKRKKILTNIKH